MRTLSVLALASLLSVVACSSDGGSSSTPGGDSGAAGSAGSAGTTGVLIPDDPASKEPATALPVCATVTTTDKTGDGCSGSVTSYGDTLCVLPGASCGQSDVCVYREKDNEYSFRCAATCQVGGEASCPLGTTCQAPDDACASGTEGVCVEKDGNECYEVGKDGSGQVGQLLAGPKGELLRLLTSSPGGDKPTSSELVLSSKGKDKSLVTWSDKGSVRGVARSADTLLLLTTTSEVSFRDGAATRRPVEGLDRESSAVLGLANDGSFVQLGWNSSRDYATVYRRTGDGDWSEVGPTRQRVSRLSALGRGFFALCADSEPCVSADGETFTTIPAPEGFDPEKTTQVDGTSTKDFYLTNSNTLAHFRGDVWATQAPAGPSTPGQNDSYYTRLRVGPDGTVVFTAPSGDNQRTTWVLQGECWAAAAPNYYTDAAPGNGTLFSAYTYPSSYCVTSVK